MGNTLKIRCPCCEEEIIIEISSILCNKNTDTQEAYNSAQKAGFYFGIKGGENDGK